MPSLEDQVRAQIDVARGLTDASLKINTGGADDVSIADALVALFEISKALMDCTVDLARAIDQLAEHTDYPHR